MATSPVSATDPDQRTERLRRRLIAARALAGLTVKQLAAEIQARGHTRGYSAENIGLMERGRRPIQPQNIPVLAAACGLSPAFFSVDFSSLEDQDELAAVGDRLERLTAELRTEQLERANLESALLEVLGEDLRQALAGEGRR